MYRIYVCAGVSPAVTLVRVYSVGIRVEGLLLEIQHICSYVHTIFTWLNTAATISYILKFMTV